LKDCLFEMVVKIFYFDNHMVGFKQCQDKLINEVPLSGTMLEATVG